LTSTSASPTCLIISNMGWYASADAVSTACETFITGYVDIRPLSNVVLEFGPVLVKQAGPRLRKVIEAMLLTAPDLELSPDRFAIDMMLSAMSGAMRSALEAGASSAMFRKVGEHVVLLCQSYMAAAIAKGA
jgi:hypothetical protein